MRLSDLERSHHSRGIFSQVLDRISFPGLIAIPNIAVIECNCSIRATKIRQLLVPALSLGTQADQQDDRSLRRRWRDLLIRQSAPIHHNYLGPLESHGGNSL